MTAIGTLGILLAISGSAISIYGALINNLKHDHKRAMQIWMMSNVVLLIWAIGYTFNIWNGGLSGIFLAAMYFIFAASNYVGLNNVR